MKKYIQKIKGKIQEQKGFTLIEMVVATALVAIFFSMAATVIPTWSKGYYQMVTLSYARQISGSIFTAVETQVLFANEVRMSTEYPGAIEGMGGDGSFLIPQKNGNQVFIEGLVYDENFYRNMKVDLSFQIEEGKTCTLTITVFSENGDKILSRTRAMKLLGKPA